jgi:hypothetical protein
MAHSRSEFALDRWHSQARCLFCTSVLQAGIHPIGVVRIHAASLNAYPPQCTQSRATAELQKSSISSLHARLKKRHPPQTLCTAAPLVVGVQSYRSMEMQSADLIIDTEHVFRTHYRNCRLHYCYCNLRYCTAPPVLRRSGPLPGVFGKEAAAFPI